MSYNSTGTGDGKGYVGTVKWGHEYSDVMLFNSASARDSFLKSHLKLIQSNITWIEQDNKVIVQTNVRGIENCNYFYYTNDSDITSTPRCCFITGYDYNASGTTTLYLEIDVFQQFVYQTAFYQSFIERATIKKSLDSVGAYTQPEPFNVNLEYESLKSAVLAESEWEPVWVLHCASKYNSSTQKYEYAGTGSNNTYGEYGFYINSKASLSSLIESYGRESIPSILQKAGTNTTTFWNKISTWLDNLSDPDSNKEETLAGSTAYQTITNLAQLQDHRNELIGLYAIPKWAKEDRDEATNNRQYENVDISLNNSTLANGYTPRNKKMLTSICRAYVLLNRNGLQVAYKPELFTANNTRVTVTAIPMSTSGYQYHVSNYKNYSASYGEVPYSSERRVGFDQNTGLNKVLSYVGAVQNIAGAAVNVGGNIASGNVAGLVTSGIPSVINAGVSAVDQIGSKGAGFGSNGDLLRITNGYSQLRFYELNPSVNEARALDDFFDMYGYTINEIYNINNSNSPVYMKGRSNWNYIKTKSLNCRCNCPSRYEDTFKSIFDNGVTIWHSYDHFADYSQTNS